MLKAKRSSITQTAHPFMDMINRLSDLYNKPQVREFCETVTLLIRQNPGNAILRL
jgi:hypothetical protein